MTNDGTDGWKLRDFRVRKCPSGGFVVSEDFREVGMASAPLAAFSTADDLLRWLREQLLPAGAGSPHDRLMHAMAVRGTSPAEQSAGVLR